MPNARPMRRTPHYGREAFDAGRKIEDRARQLIVDTRSLSSAFLVIAARVRNRGVAPVSVTCAMDKHPVRKLYAVDRAYAAMLPCQYHQIDVDLTRYQDLTNRRGGYWRHPIEANSPTRADSQGFGVLPERCVVKGIRSLVE